MTILVANVAQTNDTFGQWLTKTNQMAAAMSTYVVTTDSNTAVGNAAISGSFTALNLFANTLSGGNTSAPGTLTIVTSTTLAGQNTTFTGNVSFQSVRVNIGPIANVFITGGNTTHRVLQLSNNQLVASKIAVSDLSDVTLTALANGHILYASNGSFINSNLINVDAAAITFNTNVVANNIVSTGNSTFANLTVTNLTLSGSLGIPALTLSGNLVANNATVNNNVTVGGNTSTANLISTVRITGVAMTITGTAAMNIITSANITSNAVIQATTGVITGNLTSTGTAAMNVATVVSLAANAAISAANVNATGVIWSSTGGFRFPDGSVIQTPLKVYNSSNTLIYP